MNNKNIEIGGIYLHSSGIQYKVDKLVFDVTKYETEGQLKQKVLYTQLQDGEKYPKGTQYVRDVQDFVENFKLVDQK